MIDPSPEPGVPPRFHWRTSHETRSASIPGALIDMTAFKKIRRGPTAPTATHQSRARLPDDDSLPEHVHSIGALSHVLEHDADVRFQIVSTAIA